MPVDTAIIAPTEAGFVLRPGAAAGRPTRAPVIVAANTPRAESLWLRSIPLAVGDGLIIGRTQYQITQTMPTLEFTVLTRAWRWLDQAERPATTSALSIQWQPMTWLWPPDIKGLAWPLGLGLSALALGAGLRRHWRMAAALLWLTC